MNDANLDKDYLPEPPTPISKAWPLGGNTILVILQTCFNASSNNIRPILAKLLLYSFNASVIWVSSDLSLYIWS